MLTRIEIDGFKSFVEFALDLQPFTVVVGPNAAGKSNFFDALRLLSRLVQMDARSAVQDLRGQPMELFGLLDDSSASKHISICAEALVPPFVIDPYGLSHELSQTRIRYEVTIERRSEAPGSIERLYVVHESAVPISFKTDRWVNGARPPSKEFIRTFSKSRRKSPFLETTKNEAGERIFLARQDRTQGRGRAFPANKAETTVLSGITSASEFPHLFALREELSSFRYLQLDPAAEREPSSFLAPDELEPNGANLAAVIARIEQEDVASSDKRKENMSKIISHLASIIPTVKDINIDIDDSMQRYELLVTMKDGQVFSSRVLSDGTLRVLSLLAIIDDPRRRGILCFEEPENGVHEHRLRLLISLLRSACIDPWGMPGEIQGSMLQTIVNTHSPIVMSELFEHEIVYADMVERLDPVKKRSRRLTRMRPGVSKKDQSGRQLSLTRYEIDQLLRRGALEGA